MAKPSHWLVPAISRGLRIMTVRCRTRAQDRPQQRPPSVARWRRRVRNSVWLNGRKAHAAQCSPVLALKLGGRNVSRAARGRISHTRAGFSGRAIAAGRKPDVRLLNSWHRWQPASSQVPSRAVTDLLRLLLFRLRRVPVSVPPRSGPEGAAATGGMVCSSCAMPPSILAFRPIPDRPALLSQPDTSSWGVQVVNIPKGFKVTPSEYGVHFYCSSSDIPVDP
jgi:hypothetical protein